MSHVMHLATRKQTLEIRFAIIRLIREFFWQRDFLEVDTPLLLRLPGQEPYLSPMQVVFHDEANRAYLGYLHTSPEYTMKKMLGAGFEKIFSLGKVFRDCESFGGTHNPEFTMIEWYRANEDFTSIMRDVEELIVFIATRLQKSADWFQSWERLHMRDAWQRYAGVNLDEYLDIEAMRKLCVEKGYKPRPDEPYEDLFYRIFLNEIEPHLGKTAPTILHHYPICMAALSRVSPTDSRYAERFEVYVDGLELANCFSELVDPVEQRARLEKDRTDRAKAGKDVFAIDEEFIEALRTMPPSAGIALGVDRLVQLMAGCKNIDDVLPLPASQLFSI